MAFSLIFSIDENVVQVYDNKNIEFLRRNLVHVVLESGRCISQSERYYLVFKMAIAGFEGCLLFIAFLNFYPMVGINEIKLDETSSLAKSI